ncbi:MAG: FeoB-associated Cys-rich membrane protein [Clostridia bacterium]|nr:FeoB-associated Cys-rich membrane protein [Clostridia bacterium]
MGPIDFVIIGIVLVIVALAVWYVIRAKKRGARCIGCPSGGSCSGGCAGCSLHMTSGEAEDPETKDSRE